MRRNDLVAWFSKHPDLIVIILITFVATTLRLVALEKSPPGFYVDEAAIAAQVICLRQSGHDESGKSLPLFSEVLGGGYATPATLYGGGAWTALFGDSIASFRAFSAVHGIFTVIGIYFLALILWGRKEMAWLAALCSAVSPWSFLFSRIAWDPALAPCYLVWGFVAILYEGRFEKLRAVMGGLLLALACYTYPPIRVQAALVLPVVAFFAMRAQPQRWRAYSIAIVTFLIAMIPLVQMTLSGELQGRFNVLSIANDDYLRQFGGFSLPLVLRLFFENLGLNFAPKYLFISGDANVRHSTQAMGQWSWLEMFALVSMVALLLRRRLTATRRDLVLLLILAWSYLAGVVPAALTWESNPHALRSIGATSFLALIAGYILTKIGDRWRYAKFAVVLVAIGFSISYLGDFFLKFPARSRMWFDAPIAELAESTGQDPGPTIRSSFPEYPNLAIRYYQLRSGAARCQ